MQAKLLRVIQNRESQRIGSPEIKQVKCSPHCRDESRPARRGAQRALPRGSFYRLSSIQIRIPSRAQRLEDIPLLVKFFLKKYNDAYGKNSAGLTLRAQTLLLRHPWPGNVRELDNVISTACITATGDFIDLSDLPEHLQHRSPRLPGDDEWQPFLLDEVRKAYIQKVLQMCTAIAFAPRRFLASDAQAFTAISSGTCIRHLRVPTASPPDRVRLCFFGRARARLGVQR